MDEPPTKKLKQEGDESSVVAAISVEENPPTKDDDTTKPETSSQTARALKEVDVGICSYITKGFDPIQGIVKQRFSDFVVNEIDMNGEIVRLTTASVIEDTSSSQQLDSAEQQLDSAEQQLDSAEQQHKVQEEGCPIPSASLSELKSIVDEGDKVKSVKMLAPQEKDERRKIHMYIKANYPTVCSNCVEVDGIKYLEFSLISSARPADRRSKENSWPKDRPPHLHFTLYKEFKDTMEAIDVISKYSGIKAQQFNYAGTKDRRAKTCQKVSLFKVHADKLKKVNSKLRGMMMGNFKYCKEKISLGQLSGNHFKIVMRNVQTTAENLHNVMGPLGDVGFINYFGMQRFGTTSIPTYKIGVHILKGELELAVDLIMACRDTDQPHVTETKLLWKEKRDAKEVLKKLPKSFNIERRLMQGIIEHGMDKLHVALLALPRTTRLLYLHSYQSFLWNKAVSLRLDKFGLVPIIGDLVYAKGEVTEVQEEENPVENSGKDGAVERRNKAAVKHITADDTDKYTIYDVLLPQPGYSVLLPDNEVGEFITKMLADDNLTVKSLKATGKLREYSLPGSYRHLVVKPTNLSSSLTYYDDVTEELVQSDLDIFNEKVSTKKDSGKFQAAVFEFSLPSSSYATMLLREVMRVDTSAAHQSSLNQT